MSTTSIEKGMSGSLDNGLGRYEVRLGKAGDELHFFLAETVDHRCVCC
jgi:hypothetical protein